MAHMTYLTIPYHTIQYHTLPHHNIPCHAIPNISCMHVNTQKHICTDTFQKKTYDTSCIDPLYNKSMILKNSNLNNPTKPYDVT